MKIEAAAAGGEMKAEDNDVKTETSLGNNGVTVVADVK